MPSDVTVPEPWLRDTLSDVPATLRAVLHALQLASEEAEQVCAVLTEDELHARPFGLPPVAFHLKHIAGSIDRLLTYAEGGALSEAQIARIDFELNATMSKGNLLSELHQTFGSAQTRIRVFDPTRLEEVRLVGRKRLKSNVAGLLVHIADHTQRHMGQAITTSKLVLAQRSALTKR